MTGLGSIGTKAKTRSNYVNRFASDERGTMTIFAVFILMSLLVVGGIGVDLMLSEMKRNRLQNTLDRAILAAADLDQTQDPATVVQDYFSKAGMAGALSNVSVDEGLGYRRVNVSASYSTNTLFMRIVGYDHIVTPASGSAMEAVNNLEISLVLDVSGSMYGSKLTSLHNAGQSFVDTIFDNSVVNSTSMSVVPYSWQVNAGPQLLSQYNITNEHSYSHCAEFEDDDFDTAALSATSQLQRAGYFDAYSGYGTRSPKKGYVSCSGDSNIQMLAFSGNTNALKNRIANLRAGGNTSTEIGVKWGAALLDPSARPVLNGMIAAGHADAGMQGRPYNYHEDGALKVMVVMSDGDNTTHTMLNDGYIDGVSPVWKSKVNGRTYYSLRITENGNRDGDYRWNESYFIARNNLYGSEWFQNSPYGTSSGVGVARRLTYAELWKEMPVRRHAYLRYLANRSISEYHRWDDPPVRWVNGTEKDNKLQSVCTASKDSGVVIYTVGFQIGDHGADVLEDCASSPAHFFRVEDADLDTVFQTIATQINQLRLIE